MSRPATLSSNNSSFIPGTPGMAPRDKLAASSNRRSVDFIEIDSDNDDDELATDMDVMRSSPYFTQPTQIVNQATQPTQIVNKTTQPTQMVTKATQPTQILSRTTLRSSSPSDPSSPGTTIEVPASSPFRAESRLQSKAMSSNERKSGAASRVASLMAPAGTSFRPPVAQKTTGVAQEAAKNKYLNISDDELIEDYKHEDSSGDESPMRGDIRPSSFMKKGTATSTTTSTATSASKPAAAWPIRPQLLLTDIHDLRLRHLTKDVHRIVSKSKPKITIRECRDALQSGVGWQVSRAVNQLLGTTSVRPSASTTTSTLKSGLQTSSQNSSKGFSQSTTLSTSSHSTSSNSKSNAISTTPASHPDKSKNPPRRRLMQGRRQKSPSPTPVFSISSSASSPPTTPARSDNSSPSSQSSATMAIAQPVAAHKRLESVAVKKPRRRLQQGRRKRSPPPPVIALESDSDFDDEPITKPAASRKRKAETPLEPESEPEPIAIFTDSGEDEAMNDDEPTSENQTVLEYLNKCTSESLAQMTGLPAADAKLMVAARPFKRIADAEKVSKKDKAKSKTKSSRTEIGSLIVEKLASWFEAFQEASAVIKRCENRGKELQAAMSKWNMDKNGKEVPGAPMPIKDKPKTMADDVRLKSYQLVGLNWMSLLHSRGYSGILADDMGLGKTCQVVSMIAHLIDSYDGESEARPWPNLIVVPSSTYENWISEFERFAPDITVCPYSGPGRRDIDVEDAQEYHVVLTTYSQVERQKEDLRWLQALEPHAAIFDEGHRLKNQKTLIYKQMMQVPTEWRLILSGTPVQNNLKELLTVLHFVEPDLFGDSFHKLDTIFETKVSNKEVHNFAALAKERVANARTIMAPFILQRRKDEVLELAKKIERNEVVEMHPEQKRIYDEIKNRYLLPKGTKRTGSLIKDSNSWMQLRKAAIHHQLFRSHFTDEIVEKMTNILWSKCSEEELYVQSKEDRHKALFLADLKDKSDFQLHLWCKDFHKYIGHLDIPHRSWEESPKVQRLLELVRGYMKTGDRVLVFSRFELVIDILRETLHHAEIPYCELTGSTETSSRFPEIHRFNENPDIPVFLLTTGAGGTGLNLTAANKIVLFDQSDNPQEDVQASNRAHRIGQTRDVEVVRLITQDTVEGLVYNSCVKKLMLAACVEGQFAVDDTDENESVEQQCRRLMILENEARSSQA
ncbi:SNF2 family N-terminal domain-containing protein [Biscogniauxia mediterranea]|nr:SNF2 family N-terminal domain-containing protein [Biscogniauxia mediterranea]